MNRELLHRSFKIGNWLIKREKIGTLVTLVCSIETGNREVTVEYLLVSSIKAADIKGIEFKAFRSRAVGCDAESLTCLSGDVIRGGIGDNWWGCGGNIGVGEVGAEVVETFIWGWDGRTSRIRVWQIIELCIRSYKGTQIGVTV